MEKAEILEFVEQMKPKDHVIFFYSNPEDKHRVLFTYLKAGLDRGEAVAYVAGQESPDEIRQAMRSFGRGSMTSRLRKVSRASESQARWPASSRIGW